MTKINIFLCSPRRDGVTDHLARHFAQGCCDGGLVPIFHALRDYRIEPCIGCGNCAIEPHKCIFSNSDQASVLFAALSNSTLSVFASPVYFYATPAHFKAFIDRGQSFWEMSRDRPPSGEEKLALPILAAGRPRGKELFTSTLRTLTWFLKSFNTRIVEPKTYRGLDSPCDITGEIASGLYELGFSFASRLSP